MSHSQEDNSTNNNNNNDAIEVDSDEEQETQDEIQGDGDAAEGYLPYILRSYFKLVGEVVEFKADGMCLKCKESFKGNLKALTNLKRHLVCRNKPDTGDF